MPKASKKRRQRYTSNTIIHKDRQPEFDLFLYFFVFFVPSW